MGYSKTRLGLTAIIVICPLTVFAAMPGEGQTNWVYTVTHLHFAAYALLFLIFLLSLLNLVFQGYIKWDSWPISLIMSHVLRSSKKSAGSVKKAADRGSPAEEGIVSVRRVPKGAVRAESVPTPLNGLNHAMPNFASSIGAQTGAPRILSSKPGGKTHSSEFKFSSAVDLPSVDELARRGKEQMVVSGSVRGPDGKGMGSVIVYLTDEDGVRLGQSCRSAPETGEFKVLINEHGKYVLNGYKRGFIMENQEPLLVPIESGKIEGFNFNMIPEGCIVTGRIVSSVSGVTAPNIEVRCVCGPANYARSAKTNASGEFRIPGAPHNQECAIEVLDQDNAVLARSEPFDIGASRELFKEMIVHLPQAQQEHLAVGNVTPA